MQPLDIKETADDWRITQLMKTKCKAPAMIMNTLVDWAPKMFILGNNSMISINQQNKTKYKNNNDKLYKLYYIARPT